MFKKILPFALLALIIICIASFLSQVKSSSEQKSINLSKNIPGNAVAALESENIFACKQMFEDNAILWELITKDSTLSNFISWVSLLQSTNEGHNHPGCLSIHQQGQNTKSFILQLHGNDLKGNFKDAISKAKVGGRKTYQGHTLSMFQIDSSSYYGMQYKNLIVLSPQQELLESFIRWNDAEVSDELINNRWLKLRDTRGKKELAHIYIHPENFKKYNLDSSLPLMFSSKDLATYACLDLKVGTHDLRLTGIAELPVDHRAYLSQGCQPGKPELFDHLPNNSNAVKWWRINDWSLYTKNSSLDAKTYVDKSTANKLDMVQLDYRLQECFGDEMAISESSSSEVFAIEINDELLCKTLLELKSVAEYQSYTIYNIPALWSEIFGLSQKHENAVIINKVLYSCGSELDAKEIISAVINGNTLSKRDEFESLFRGINLHGTYISLRLKGQQTEKKKEVWNRVTGSQAHVFSFLKDERSYQEYYVSFEAAENKTSDSLLWSINLDHQLRFAPIMVTNHYSDENEILSIESEGTLSLITKSGRILWKKSLPALAQRPPIQIDAFKNGKLQLFLNTENSLELIDRNGNDVSPFPYYSTTPFSSPALVVDYDLNRDYRIIVAKGNRIFNYTLEAQETKGWKVFECQAPVSTKPWYLKIGNKDYLVALDDEGSVYVLNRRGEIRFPTKAKLRKAVGEIHLIKGSSISDSYFEYVDFNGKLSRQYLNGKETSFELSDGGVDQAAKVSFGEKDCWVVLHNGTVKIFNPKNQLIGSYNDVMFPFIESHYEDFPLIMNFNSLGEARLLSAKMELESLANRKQSSVLIGPFKAQGAPFILLNEGSKLSCIRFTAQEKN